MFAQALASSTESVWRKLGSMFLSFVLHALVVAVALISPLLVTRVLLLADCRPPSLVATLNFSPRPGDPSRREPQPNTLHIPKVQVITMPPDVASRIKAQLPDAVEPRSDLLVISRLVAPTPKVNFGTPGVCGCVRGGIPRGVPLPANVPFVGQQSWMHQAVLVRRVDPQYPALAKRAGIQGAVVVHATIDHEGLVVAASVLSGPQQLRGAALDAIRQWQYQPYILNGLAVEIETTITVNFVLPGAAGQNVSRVM